MIETPETMEWAINNLYELFGDVEPHIEAMEGYRAAWEADCKDAQRYRWLRNGNGYAPEEAGVVGGEELDKMCDVALATEAKNE